MNYRLDVIAVAVAEAVRHVGGLMCDLSLAGWHVRVFTDDTQHPQALSILGARAALPAHADDGRHGPDQAACTLIVSLDQPEGHSRDRVAGDEKSWSSARLEHWRLSASDDLAGLHPVRHQLSAAARRFKAAGLRCAGLDIPVEPSEQFWTRNGPDSALFDHVLSCRSWPESTAAPTDNIKRVRTPSLEPVGECPRG